MLTITFHKLLMYTTFSYFTNATKYNIKRNKSTKYQNQHQACTPTKLKAYPSLHGSHLRITEPCNLLSKVAEKKPKHLNLVRGTCPTYSPYYYQPQLKNFMTNMHLSPQSQVPNLKMPNIKNIKDFWNTGERKFPIKDQKKTEETSRKEIQLYSCIGTHLLKNISQGT